MQIALWLSAAILTFVIAPNALAEKYPTRPIRLIVPFAPGGTDILGRVVAAAVSESLGQTVVVDNRPGAGGAIGAEMAVNAEPDGYTLLMTSSSYAASAAYRKLQYDPVNDIQPIILMGTTGLVFTVHPSVPVKSVKELIAHAKANPGRLNYGSVGTGSINHLAIELFKLETQVNMVHIPYKGAGQGLPAALAGEIQLAPFGLVATLPHVRAGRLRAIGITTPKRSTLLPDVPTIGEVVPEYQVIHWYGVWGPKRMPKNIVTRWNKEVAKVLLTDEMKRQMARQGLEPGGGSPEQFYEIIKRDVEKWKRVIKEAKIELAD